MLVTEWDYLFFISILSRDMCCKISFCNRDPVILIAIYMTLGGCVLTRQGTRQHGDLIDTAAGVGLLWDCSNKEWWSEISAVWGEIYTVSPRARPASLRIGPVYFLAGKTAKPGLSLIAFSLLTFTVSVYLHCISVVWLCVSLLEVLLCFTVCMLCGCKKRAHSVSWPEFVKGIPNQGVDCSVSWAVISVSLLYFWYM